MTDRVEQLLTDEEWDDVSFINSHAVLMGYLSMAIKGLGYLMLTWTTVVLLGGFVSVLHKKDFWCLTFITLVQTAGVFDAVLNEKLSYIENAVIALLRQGFLGARGYRDSSGDTGLLLQLAYLARSLLPFILLLVQVPVLVTVLCPLAIIYMLGILLSGGISLWRLIDHDYSNMDSNGEESNLTSAMDTLYYLALLQGVLFCYRLILHRAQKRLADDVAYNSLEFEVVFKYLRETRKGCEKDPSFAKGRNLITVAIDKICSNSLVDCIYGVKMLYTSILIVERRVKNLIKDSDDCCRQWGILSGQSMLMKHLVFSVPSSRRVLQKLLEMLDSRGEHDREIRNKAAVIVERLAFNINLEKFPRGIQHISSLVGTLQEYREYEQHWFMTPSPAAGHDDASGELGKSYKVFLLHGLSILRNLAADENNCRIMSDTPDVVSKIMAPVTSDLLHHTTEDHGAWSSIVERSIQVMSQLATAPGEIGVKLRRQISSCKEAISTLRRILSCNECMEGMRTSVICILTRLYIGTTESSSSREDFVMMLVDIFTHNNSDNNSLRKYSGEALSEICFHGGTSDARIIIQTNGDVVDSLTKVLKHDKNDMCRQAAAEILEHLCTHYTKDDEFLGKLKEAMTRAMLEVLGEIIHCGQEKNTRKEAGQEWFAKQTTDIENQCYDTGENDEKEKEFRAIEKPVRSANLLSSLLSLCGTVYDTFSSELDPDLSSPLDASGLLNKLKNMVVENSDPTMENLPVFKAIAKTVISVMKKHISGSIFVKQEVLESLIEALSSASKNMQDLDYSMVFHSANRFKITLSKLNRCTLASLVKEAKELHGMVPSTSASG